MANNRFHDAQKAGALARARRAELQDGQLSLQEAIDVIVDVHTRPGDGRHGFEVNWTIPDFTKVSGDLYWAAWRVMRAARSCL
jgi:hypothetical protein